MRRFTVNVFFDKDAGVYVASSENVPGLAAESESLDALVQKLRTLVPELLELNHELIDKGYSRNPNAPYDVITSFNDDNMGQAA